MKTMRTLKDEELRTEYLIYKSFTPAPGKNYQTNLAMRESSNEIPCFFIVKEIDEKRARIYQTLANMWNPYIAETYEVIQLTSSEKYVAITEYVCADGSPEKESLSLKEFVRQIGPLPEKTALSICIQICEGLTEFHQKGLVHRDLKPDNIMISKYDTEDPQIKIIDFGGAKHDQSTVDADTTVIGTLGYQAPESLSSATTSLSDIYSIGCILNFLLTGNEPGVEPYKKNHYIVTIIEKATSKDPHYRYLNTTSMKKHLEHELGSKWIDHIPFLRAIPGFRTHTTWKAVISSLFWIRMLYISTIYPQQYGIMDFMQLLCHILLSLILLCNMGNFLRFFPKSLRKNNFLFLMIRLCLMLTICFTSMLLENPLDF